MVADKTVAIINPKSIEPVIPTVCKIIASFEMTFIISEKRYKSRNSTNLIKPPSEL